MTIPQTVNIHDAKSQLSKLIESVESGQTDSVIIARAGKAVVRLVALEKPTIRLGIADGSFDIPDPDEALDAEIASSFETSEIFPG